MHQKKLFFARYDYASFAAFAMYSVCSLAIPLMIVAMGKSLNFPLDAGGMASGGMLHAARSIFMVIALLLCGMIAARIGKRITMGLSILCFGLGMLCCSLSSAYWMLFPCLIGAGFGEGICEGIATPFVQDLHPDAPERYVNISHAFWSVGIVLAVVLVGGCLTLGIHWRIVLSIVGVLTLIASLGFLWKESRTDPYPESREAFDYGAFWKKTKDILGRKRFWLCSFAMFFGAGAEFGITFWAAAYIELTFKTSTFVAGLGTGMIALGMFLGRTFFGYIAKPDRLRYILLFSSLGTIPLMVVLAFLHSGLMPRGLLFTILFLILFLVGIGIAPYWPTTQVFGVNKLPECDSTLLYVYFSTLGVPGCGIFSWLMGVMGDHFGLKGSILLAAFCVLIFCLIIIYSGWISRDKAAE